MKPTWQIKKLGEIADHRKFSIVDGPFGTQLHTSDYTNKGVPLIRVINIKPNQFVINKLKYISEEKFQELRRSEVKPDDILIAKTGATFGKTCLFPADIDKALITASCCKITVNREIVNPSFICFQINTSFFYNQLKGISVKSGQPGFNLINLRKLKLILPPLPIQKAIVERLGAIKKAQELNDKQIALADELFQSLLHRELNPKEKDWEIKRLKEVTKITMGQSPPSSTYNTEGRGLPFFQGKFEFKEIYPIPIKFCSQPIRIAKKNDVLLSVRAPVGPVNLSPSECCIGRGLSAIRANAEKLDQFFLFYFMKLNENKMSFLGSGSTFSAIGRNRIEGIKIPLPPLPTQRQIVQKLQVVQEYKKKLIGQKQKLKELFESCLNKAMKGKLVI